MFVFKAAVVGAGGELAQAIAAAGIPVLLKGEGLERARAVSEKATAKLVEKGRLTERGRGRRGRADPRPDHADRLLRRLRRRRLRDRGRRGRPGAQARGLRRARRGHARPRDPGHEHLRALGDRDRRGHAAPGQGRRLPSRRPAHRRDRRGRRHVARDRAGRGQLRPADPPHADPLRRHRGLRGRAHRRRRRPVPRGLPRARGGRRRPARHRRGRGRRVRARRRAGPGHDRARRAAGDPAPAARPGPPRREGRPGLLPVSARRRRRRRSSSSCAARSRSSGSTTRPRTRSRRT